MTRSQAIDAYRRVRALSDRRHAKIRSEILVPVFGGCGCRMHNCQVNYEVGFNEGPQHYEQYKLAKRFKYLESRNYEQSRKLADHFARYF